MIDSSPFTLPNIGNTIFLGDKKSSIFTIDIEKGIIVSKISNSGSVGYINQKPIQTNNLLTVIRTDYTLSSFNQITGAQSWNVTVSDIMAIQKGSKNELAVNWPNQNSNDLMGKINKVLENPNLNSIVSIHNYISDSNLPIKIYDNKKVFNPLNNHSELDFEKFVNLNKHKFFKNPSSNIKFYEENNNSHDEKVFNNSPNSIQNYEKSPYYYNYEGNNQDIKINFEQIFNDYLKYSNKNKKENSDLFNLSRYIRIIIYKFWEIYYFDDHFYLYIIIIILFGVIVYLYKKNSQISSNNNKLKDKLKLRKKSNDTLDEKNHISEIVDNENQKKNFIELNNKKDVKIEEVTCFRNDSETICIYSENKIINKLKNIINLNVQDNENIKMIEKSNYTENIIKETKLESQNLSIPNEAKLHLINNTTQFEELFKPQLELDLKKNEIYNEVESTLCFIEDTDGKILKIENKKLITKYDKSPEVTERIIQVSGQIGLANFPKNNPNIKLENNGQQSNYFSSNNNIKTNIDDHYNEGVICEYRNNHNENSLQIYNNFTNKNFKSINERKFSEKLELSKKNSNKMRSDFPTIENQNSEDYFRAKSNDINKEDFQPIKFVIKAVKDKEKTVSSLEFCNASSNYYKIDSISENNNRNSDTNFTSERNICNDKKIGDSLVLIENINKLNVNIITSETNTENTLNIKNVSNNLNNNNLLNLNNEKSRSKFRISVKDRSRSKGNIRNGSSNNSTGHNEKIKNNNLIKKFENSPAGKKTKFAEINENQINNNIKSNEKNKKNLQEINTSLRKTNNLNLRCKYKEYKEFNITNDPNDKNKLLKIDTTFIDEGRIGKNFEDFSKVGEGGFGSVFKAKHKIDGSLYAIKVIKLNVGISQSLKDHKVIKEVKTMMKLYHKNVVRYYTCWFQLNIEEIKNLKSSSDEESQISSSYASKSNFATKTMNKLHHKHKNNKSCDSYSASVTNFNKCSMTKEKRNIQIYESEYISETWNSKFYNNNYYNDTSNKKVIKKINFNNFKEKSKLNSEIYNSPEKSQIHKTHSSQYNNAYFNSNSRSKINLSKSESKNKNNLNYVSNTINKKSNKNIINMIELNGTKSAILNQISEYGESDLNSKNKSEAGGFNWEDSNFISKKISESFEKKSQFENSIKRGRSSENCKSNVTYVGNSFWNETKRNYIENSIKHVDFAKKINIEFESKEIADNKLMKNYSFCDNKDYNKSEKNNTFQDKEQPDKIVNYLRKLSSLTVEINPDNNLENKKAFSISLEKNAEEILSDSIDDNNNIYEFSNDESKNISKSTNNNNKNNLCSENNKINNNNKNRNLRKKLHVQDDSILYLTKRKKKNKKEFIYNVYFLVQMEFCDGLSLNQYLELNKIKGLNRHTIFLFFKQILSGVNQIHKTNIIHRDLK